jgi:hypothetical protein
MLQVLDTFFSVVHLVVIAFNLSGWIFPATRKLHLITMGATAASWFILGIWYGLGYCPITDWQWNIKEQLGEKNLPASFIKYFADKITGKNFPSQLVNQLTLSFFLLVVVCTVYVNVRQYKQNVKKRQLQSQQGH